LGVVLPKTSGSYNQSPDCTGGQTQQYLHLQFSF
jgi:hypothetical protein